MRRIGIKYGVFCGLTYIVFFTARLYLYDSPDSNPFIGILFRLAMFLTTFALIYNGISTLKKSHTTEITIKKSIQFGALAGFIGALITSVFVLFFHYLIDTTYTERYLEELRSFCEEKGMTLTQIQKTLDWTSMIRNPIITSILIMTWYTLWGTLKGLFSGLLLRRTIEKPG